MPKLVFLRTILKIINAYLGDYFDFFYQYGMLSDVLLNNVVYFQLLLSPWTT
jgi:hypothetical protein